LTSRNLKHGAAFDGTAALLLAGIIMVLGSGLPARAQSEEARFNNRLAGTWRLQITVQDCETGAALRTFPALAAFSKGGTLTLTTAGQLPSLSTTGLGVWQHTKGHSYSAVAEVFVFSTAGDWIQTHRLTRAIEIGNTGDEFTETIDLEILDTNGNLIAPGCATSVATRFK
jgi:hypothetical protein